MRCKNSPPPKTDLNENDRDASELPRVIAGLYDAETDIDGVKCPPLSEMLEELESSHSEVVRVSCVGSSAHGDLTVLNILYITHAEEPKQLVLIDPPRTCRALDPFTTSESCSFRWTDFHT